MLVVHWVLASEFVEVGQQARSVLIADERNIVSEGDVMDDGEENSEKDDDDDDDGDAILVFRAKSDELGKSVLSTVELV